MQFSLWGLFLVISAAAVGAALCGHSPEFGPQAITSSLESAVSIYLSVLLWNRATARAQTGQPSGGTMALLLCGVILFGLLFGLYKAFLGVIYLIVSFRPAR